MQADNLPGVVVGIWIPGKGELFLAKGKANIETGASRNVDDPFRIASITKTFTSCRPEDLRQGALERCAA